MTTTKLIAIVSWAFIIFGLAAMGSYAAFNHASGGTEYSVSVGADELSDEQAAAIAESRSASVSAMSNFGLRLNANLAGMSADIDALGADGNELADAIAPVK